MFRFERYNEDEEIWDDFVMEKSVNGTFLQTRRFLNYHPKDRFVDESIIIYNKKNNIAAVCPACLIEEDGKKIFFSHKGTTFGGIIIDKKHYRAKYLIEMVKEFKEFILKENFDEMYLKMTSDIFSRVESDLFQYAFQYNDFKEFKELSTYIDLDTYKEDILSNFAQGKRTNVHNCVKEGLLTKELEADEEIKVFYDILCENLSKYDTKPVHTLQELLELKKNRLKSECGFYGLFSKSSLCTYTVPCRKTRL